MSGLTKKTCILAIITNNKLILRSMLAAGIVQERLLEKLEKASKGGEVETTGGYFYHPGRKFFPFRSNRISIANH